MRINCTRSALETDRVHTVNYFKCKLVTVSYAPALAMEKLFSSDGKLTCVVLYLPRASMVVTGDICHESELSVIFLRIILNVFQLLTILIIPHEL